MNSILQERKNRVKHISLSLLLAALSGALGLLNWIMLRELILKLLPISSINPWSWRAIDNFSFVLFGVMWLSFVLFSQHFYQKSAEKKKLRKNVLFLTGIQLLLLFLCQLLPFLFGATRFEGANLLLLLAQCIFGLVFIIVPRIKLRKK